MLSKKWVRAVLIVVAVACVAVCLVSAVFLIQYYKSTSSLESLKTQVKEPDAPVETPEEPEDAAADETPEEPEDAEPEPVVLPVDFAALQEVNPDIYAWLEIPGTTIDQPVLQHPTDQLYYHYHDYSGASSIFGAVYSQSDYNDTSFDAPMTVLYGHDTVFYNPCAFAELNNYADALYFDEHRTVLVYTPEAVYTYRVFAAYVHNNEHLLACHDFADPAVFTQFFDELAQTPGLYGCVLEDELPEPGDLVLTLSTCFRTNRNQRFLVQAVLEETAYVEGEAE